MDTENLFWELVEPLYSHPAVTHSTMMGYPCVRIDGKFFATIDREGHMIVKLPAERVNELIESGTGIPFAPNGRVFREWVAFAEPDEARWESLIEESKDFVSALDG